MLKVHVIRHLNGDFIDFQLARSINHAVALYSWRTGEPRQTVSAISHDQWCEIHPDDNGAVQLSIAAVNVPADHLLEVFEE